jgi:hypothetical protein
MPLMTIEKQKEYWDSLANNKEFTALFTLEAFSDNVKTHKLLDVCLA